MALNQLLSDNHRSTAFFLWSSLAQEIAAGGCTITRSWAVSEQTSRSQVESGSWLSLGKYVFKDFWSPQGSPFQNISPALPPWTCGVCHPPLSLSHIVSVRFLGFGVKNYLLFLHRKFSRLLPDCSHFLIFAIRAPPCHDHAVLMTDIIRQMTDSNLIPNLFSTKFQQTTYNQTKMALSLKPAAEYFNKDTFVF